MGQCVSSRSGKGEIARKKGVPPTKYPFKGPHFKMEGRKSANAHTKGEAMSFGFKAQPVNNQTNYNKTQITTEKKDTSMESVVNNQTTARSGTPRLARPKKDANGNCGARTNRFGFRSPAAPLSNKVADSQTFEAPSLYIDYTDDNNGTEIKSSLKLSSSNRSNASDSSRSTCSSTDENNKQSKFNGPGIPKLQSATRFTLHTSQLPRPQFPVRLATTPANYHSTDKNAKTAANKVQQKTCKAQSENGSSSASSVTDADSGVGSQKSGTDLETPGIEHLDESPSAKNKLRNSTIKKSRPMEMVFTSNQKKTFELRELNDAIEVTEIVPLQLPPKPNHRTQQSGIVMERTVAYQQALRDHSSHVDQQIIFSSDEDECFDESFGDEPCGEEKQHRDRMLSEKNEKGCIGAGESEAEELWGGVGEAMICDDDLSAPSNADNNQDVDSMNPPLRSVLLTIEDPAFATLAAMSTSAMIEDETSPDFSSSPPSSAAELPITQPSSDSNKRNLAGGTPESPGTPTHASNSLSLSEGRDFLIDDEIADQPGLVFDEGTSSANFTTGNSSGNTIVPEDIIEHCTEHPENFSFTDVPPPSKTSKKVGHISEDCSPAHNASVGTLSSCESIASDDLMLDFDPSETSSTFGDNNLDTRIEMGGFIEKDEETLRMIQNDEVLRDRSSRLPSGLGNGVRATRLLRPRVGSSGSGGGESPRSLTLDSQRLRSSPLRTSRQGTSSPGEDLSDDSGIRLDRETYQDMFQDVINIKTMLYRLKRVFQNQETENAFDNTLPNGLYYNLGHDGATEDSSHQKKDADVADELTDLRRQVVFLQQQLKEKDRIVQNLQESITRLKEVREDKHNLEVTRETCNAATQTERVRPVSSGPSLLQGLPNDGSGGSLVSFRLGKQYE
ncbi:uncharacterized protein LOC142322131 isoform X2 [Lycorma delicatula]|uniref:uncharacterized protein LOC142322131 isoform X2 n=1 Tax=Lycorma delicatula TaxID=130591 RepID=UPI003F5137AC